LSGDVDVAIDVDVDVVRRGHPTVKFDRLYPDTQSEREPGWVSARKEGVSVHATGIGIGIGIGRRWVVGDRSLCGFGS
jgi:hypothetical protein